VTLGVSHLDFSPHWALLCYRPKTRSSALFSLDCPLVDWQRAPPSVLPARDGDQELLLLPGKPDGPIWHSWLSSFSVLGLPCPTGGRCVRNGHLLRKSLHSQNLQQVRPSPVEGHRRWSPWSIPPCSRWTRWVHHHTEVPMAQAFVAQPRSKALDDDLVDDDPGLLNFATTESETIYRTSPRL
jgi:hypothetical protein